MAIRRTDHRLNPTLREYRRASSTDLGVAPVPGAVDQLENTKIDLWLAEVADRLERAEVQMKQGEKNKAECRTLFFALSTEKLKRNGYSDEEAANGKYIAHGTEGHWQRVPFEKGGGFDFEAFENERPGLYDKLVRVQIETNLILDEAAMEEALDEDPSLLPVFQSYAIPGTISHQLRKAKPEEKNDDA